VAGAVAAAVLANLLGGSSYVLTKIALDGLTETTLVVVRTVVALIVLVPLAGPRLAPLLRTRGRERRRLVVMGAAGYALPLVLASYGLRRSTATNASLLIAGEPLGIALAARAFLGEHLGRVRVAALLLGAAGATVLAADGIPLVTRTYTPHPVGDLLLLAASVAWAPYSIAGKLLLDRYDPVGVSAASLLVALPCLAPFAAFESWGADWDASRLPSAIAAAVALGLLVSAGMTLLWNVSLRAMDASRLAGFVALQPLAGVLLARVALGERTGAFAVLGGALVLAGVYLLNAEGWRAARRPS
jgi:drug/metabolite transporter (DMT)-like permease